METFFKIFIEVKYSQIATCIKIKQTNEKNTDDKKVA